MNEQVLSRIEPLLKEAVRLDREDPLAQLREAYHLPRHANEEVIYFCGNSLGLAPKSVEDFMSRELNVWKAQGVQGHILGDIPWVDYQEGVSVRMASLVGAKPDEVVVMNTLTTNLHLMMVSFYRPTAQRYKILVESQLFPSDYHAVCSQAKFHGYDPEKAVLELAPQAGEHSLRTEAIFDCIDRNRESLALIMLGGVNYYSGQLFLMEEITRFAKERGIMVGWDLAHAVGNVPLNLHEWGPDFAAWCSYKYLNGGPGAMGGVFVHERHTNKDLPRFEGWWGHDSETRFKMEKKFIPMPGASAWQLSNVPVFSTAPLYCSLALFEQAGGMLPLRKKSLAMTELMNRALESLELESLEIITPKDPNERGAQFSMRIKDKGYAVFNYLMEHGVILDWREPDVLRLAPVPMYNTYRDIIRFCELLAKAYQNVE